MEFADVQADLQALRKLYCLLQSSASTSDEILDERAKHLFKNLLDGATEKALESSSKIIAAAAAAELDFSKAEKFSVIPKIKSSVTDSIFTNPSPETLVSGSSMSDKVSNRKKRCGFCEGSRMKQKETVVAAYGNKRNYGYMRKQGNGSVKANQIPSDKMIKETQVNPHDGKPILELEKKSGNASTEVSNAIRRIESAILSSKSFSHVVNGESVRNGQLKKDNWSDRHIRANYHHVTQRNSTQQLGQRTLNNVNSTRRLGQIVRKNVGRKELLSPSTSPKDHLVLAEEALKLQKRKEDKRSVKSISSIMRPTLLRADSDSNINQTRRHMDQGSSPDCSESMETATSYSGSSQRTFSSTNSDTDKKPNSLLQRRFSDKGNKSSSDSEERSSTSPTRKYRLDHHANPEAVIGRLRRLKNKFRFIFHHHHYHHHHHHKYKDNYDSDESGQSKANFIKPKWKHLPSIFRHENKKEAHGKYKSRAILMSTKDHANQFHTLMQGLRRHAKDSKKSKGGKGRNSVNKVHWWHNLKRNGGVKLGKKGRVRLGLKSKNHYPRKLR